MHPRSSHIVYLFLTGAVFVAFAIVFLFFPRTRYSETEKRELATFPDISDYEGNLAQFTADISQWFSDSEPYRDQFMGLSMRIRSSAGISKPGAPEEQISFRPPESAEMMNTDDVVSLDEPEAPAGNPMEGANAKLANSGTIVVGSGEDVRALMVFGGSPRAGLKFATAANKYGEALPGVRVYALVAPIATEFYLPSKGARLSNPQKPVIDNLRDALSADVNFVDAYSALAAHTNEDIYLRTDHHWAPLGAFYAAKAFARTAGVPFRELDSYDSRTIHNFVGSMFGYTKDIAVKNAPENFTYYTPRNLDYKSYFTTYKADKNYHITSSSGPYESQFFRNFKDGSANAYLTFMGSDQNLVKVVTGTPSSRRLLVIKDSYGNALPGYLFFSFGEVHVIDFRYFPGNVKDYVAQNGITDVLLAFNIFNACNNFAMNRISGFLEHSEGVKAPAPEPNPEKDTEPEAAPEPTNETVSEPETLIE